MVTVMSVMLVGLLLHALKSFKTTYDPMFVQLKCMETLQHVALTCFVSIVHRYMTL